MEKPKVWKNQKYGKTKSIENLIKFLILSFILIQAYSCLNEELASDQNIENISSSRSTILTQQEAEKKFSEILSKVTYEEPMIRAFLKNQALQRKDNDHNVFYPLTKNEIVTGKKTFVEVLKGYTGYKEELEDIEKAAPLLNIFIPDLTLFDESLSIYNLDINDSDIPVFNAGKFYWNGIVVDSIIENTINELPMFHTFVVNESPRRKIKNPTTRSVGANVEYDFIDDAYNPRCTNVLEVSTRGRKKEPIYRPEVLSELLNPNNKYVPRSEFPAGTLNAFNKIGAGNGVLRPMMYYNLNQIEEINSDIASLDYRVKDVIYRMKIDPSLYSYISKHKDANFQSPFLNDQWKYIGNNGDPDFDRVLKQLWTQGNFVFKINVATGDYSQLITIAISPQDLFSVTLRGTFKHKTWFQKREYTYWIVSGELGSKWIYPHKKDIDTRLSSWNPIAESYKRTIFVSVAGSNATVRKEVSVSSTTVKKSSGSASVGPKITFPIGEVNGEASINLTQSWERQNTDNTTSKITIEITDKDIDLGNNFVHFFGSSPILEVKNNRVYLDTERYGLFDMCIIPVDCKLQ